MLRRGEVFSLRDADVDLANGSVAVFTQQQGGRRVATKTRAGRRRVDVGPQVVRLLREQQLARAPNRDGYLFPTRRSTPTTYVARLQASGSRRGVPELTFPS
jgi:integrase